MIERRQLPGAINPGPDKNISSEQAFQNIQVLKDTPAGCMAPTRTAFTIVLNVDCSHCHVADQHNDDDKTAKQKTREMVRMVRSVNHQFFDDLAKGGMLDLPSRCGQTRNNSNIPELRYG